MESMARPGSAFGIHSLAARAVFAALIAGLASLASCDFPNPILPEHEDPNYNWIAGFGFQIAGTPFPTDPSPAPSPAPLQATGWYLPFESDPYIGDGFPYATMTDTATTVGAEAVPGLSAEAPVYRLEIDNLFQEADLEADGLGAPDGSRFELIDGGIPSVPSFSISDTADAIHGHSLVFDCDAEDYVRMFVSDNLDNVPPAGSLYQVNLLYKKLETQNYFYFAFENVADSNSNNPFVSIPSAITDIRDYTAENVGITMYFGDKLHQHGAVDDIRVTRRIIDLGLRMDVSPTVVSATLTPGLIPGRYRFSVWVLNDPLAYDLYGAGARDPYRSRALTLAIRTNDPAWGSTGGIDKVITAPSGGYPVWTKVSAEMSLTGGTVDFDPTRPYPVLSLHIYAADVLSAGGLDPGSILIAQPELNYLLD